eukprot:496029-Pelagomonas_calceolata.AAC.1
MKIKGRIAGTGAGLHGRLSCIMQGVIAEGLASCTPEPRTAQAPTLEQSQVPTGFSGIQQNMTATGPTAVGDALAEEVSLNKGIDMASSKRMTPTVAGVKEGKLHTYSPPSRSPPALFVPAFNVTKRTVTRVTKIYVIPYSLQLETLVGRPTA